MFKVINKTITCTLLIGFFGLLIFSTVSASNINQSKPLDLSAYKGKVVMVDFWISWCKVCQESFPWLNKIQKEKSSQDLIIIGINVDEDLNDANNFLHKYPANFKLLFDSAGHYAEYYKILGMLTTLIFNHNGQLIHQHVGFKSKKIDEYEQLINLALTK